MLKVKSIKEYRKLELIIALIYALTTVLSTYYVVSEPFPLWSKIIFVIFLAICTFYIGRFLRIKKKEAEYNEKLK